MFLAHEGSMAAYHYHRLLLDPSDITAPPTNKTNISDANFDSNMMIILAALLCALLCAVALNSIVRCFLRCTASPAHDTAAVAVTATGVKKAALSWIPVVAYEAGPGPPIDCPICLGELAGGEDVRLFPICNHAFHVKCIDRWLLLHSSCPTCRQPLIQHSSISSADHVRVQIN
ncbi:RING-H2 finger protein ATL74-like [Salvia miltiorrhiza]|uniref:RING-H2 finger protein ATL74-like n=1 Tax=Salvia miltiorrhiza TaxID=226208 RepID=UPI0025ACBC30|nr:RING-H2 finger protein ATL74-like [Salvia miltiorrhiza]